MDTNHLSELRKLGLKSIQIQAWLQDNDAASGALLGRIAAVDRGLCTAWTAPPAADPTEPHTRASNDAAGDDAAVRGDAAPPPTACELRVRPPRSERIAVGDWGVVVREGSDWRVQRILPRTSLLERSAASERSETQPIAANVDVVFIVIAIAETNKLTGRSLNPRRLERYLTATRQAGAQPVVVVNKTDLRHDESLVDALVERFSEAAVVRLSATVGDPSGELSEWLVPGDTAVLVGSSGVGKSTLSNGLLGRSALATADVRGADGKGRHTTTRRTLHVTPSGVLLIDTPGMREFGIASSEGLFALDAAEPCRFSDCTHQLEPGCAVREAVRTGELSEAALQERLALREEALRQQARHDAYSRHLVHERDKRFGRMVREVKRKKQKW